MASHGDSSARPDLGSFTIDEAVREWHRPLKDWHATHRNQGQQWDGIATACAVFNREGKVLIIQRAAHDSLPHKWEMPGGAVDSDDTTILHAAARELWEEAGMVARRFVDVVCTGPDRNVGDLYRSRDRTKTWCRFTFLVEVQGAERVVLDPNEHQDYFWATEEEIRGQRSGERGLTITKDTVVALILEAFRMRRKRSGAL
ncbi:NUDIX hydrolase domain-like protein [Neohortaea acidophila]|uniref:NUDIX hydrolase domain-like protein n=1 Tax=Neohortaea acidophila TaxID=245834 RepID=A0A6A6PNJ4_9PEZI|nr:NUDIX hydrolase domain-like protein [Neohortaea acidophila]KAF2481003.1 NUDIX hydrolase domain-like protein [Neohortaea acidophila]